MGWAAAGSLAFALVAPVGGARATPAAPAHVPTIKSLPFWVDPQDAETGSALNAVGAVAPDDVWAVGATYGGGRVAPLIQHWDGEGWTTVAGADVRGALTALSVVGRDDIWAAGYRYPGSREVSLLEHWDGHTWSLVRFPPYPGVYLTGVAAQPGNRVVAVGVRTVDGVIIRGSATIRLSPSGASERQVPNPPGFWKVLDAVALLSPAAGWRVGELLPKHGYREQASAEHWNGHRWLSVPPIQAGDSTALLGLSIARPGDVWAVGARTSSVGRFDLKLVEHWSDNHWSVVPTPDLHAHSSVLNAVAATSDSNVWVVGRLERNRHEQTLSMHWDGHTWQAFGTPNHGSFPSLAGVTVGPHATWTVGSDLDTPGPAYRDTWNGRAWVAR